MLTLTKAVTVGQFCALKLPQSGSILRAQYHTKLFWSDRSKGKSYIISGFNQAYVYACDYNEPCAFLVIFKMCSEGLNFLVPSTQATFPSMTVNNKTIFFVVVDIFEYGTSASKRGPLKSFDISERELVQSVET